MAQCAVPTKEGKVGVPLRSPRRPTMGLLAVGTVALSVGVATLPVLAPTASAATAAAAVTSQSASSVQQSEWWLKTLNVSTAWLSSQGKGVTVAVLSDGVDAKLPDLAGAVKAAPSPLGASVPVSPYFAEQGSPIASLIAGRGQAPTGQAAIMGVAPGASILSIPVTLPPGDAKLNQATVASAIPAAIAAGIKYAVNHGATVIDLPIDVSQPGNNGSGGTSAGAGGSTAEEAAVRYAVSHNVVLVAPAGDDGAASDAPNYPAAYRGVIAVGAFDKEFVKAPWSSHQTYVTLTAGGVGVMAAANPGSPAFGATGTHSGAGTGTVNGPAGTVTMNSTTAASAMVSGIVAIIRSRYPSLSAAQIRQALITTTSYRRKNGLSDGSGYGAVNASRALAAAAQFAAKPSQRAGAHAQPRQAPAAVPLASGHRKVTSELIRSGALSAGLLLLLLAAIIAYARSRRRRVAKARRAAAPEWTQRTAQSRYPTGRGAGADRMLEMLAAPPPKIERPKALPTRNPRGDLGAFAAVAGRQAAAQQIAGKAAAAHRGDVLQPANAGQVGGGMAENAELANGGDWANYSPASRAVSKRASVAGRPPWDPASPPNSDLPWTMGSGEEPAGVQTPEAGEPAASLPPGPAPVNGGQLTQGRGGISPSTGSGAPWDAPDAMRQAASWDASAATNRAPWDAPPTATNAAPWGTAPEPTDSSRWDDQAASQPPSWDAQSGSGAPQVPAAGWRAAAAAQQREHAASWDESSSYTTGSQPRVSASGLPIRQPQASKSAPLSPSGSLWEPFGSQSGDSESGGQTTAQDQSGRPIFTWDPRQSADRYQPPAGE
ncbi:MAG TPA: S8 family serine peptidase [Streptosporangiaceae bacterium]|nr:S8 family serine peptidase [Streptosporangiaceae bacterium]